LASPELASGLLIQVNVKASRQLQFLRIQQRRNAMPADTVIIISAIVAIFAFFAAIVTYGDVTWDKHKSQRPRR
jgi:hypothetical protein